MAGVSWSRRCHLLGGARLLSVDVEVTRLGYSEYGDPSKVDMTSDTQCQCTMYESMPSISLYPRW